MNGNTIKPGPLPSTMDGYPAPTTIKPGPVPSTIDDYPTTTTIKPEPVPSTIIDYPTISDAGSTVRNTTSEASQSTEKDECVSSPRQNGGTCVDGINSYNCNCNVGYT